MNRYHVGLASAIAVLCAMPVNYTLAQDADDEAIEEIVVTGIRGSLAQSLNLKKNSGQIVDSITSEDIGKFPDQNIAESLQRVPGVQIQRGLDDTAGSSSGDGEGSTVSIRGMRPDLNKTTVNGASQSSTTGGRDFNFSNLAPELVQRIEVFKTPTADQDEGAIGGTINLVTRKPREIGKLKAVGAAKITQHQLADATNYKLSGLVSNVFGDNDRFGALLSVNYSDDELRRDSVESFGWNIMTDAEGDTGLVARDIRPNLKLEDRQKLMVNGSLEFQATERLNLRADFIFSDQQQDEQASNYQLRVGNNGTINDITVNADDTAVFASTSPRNASQRFHRVVAFNRTDTRTTSNVVLTADWAGDKWDISPQAGFTTGEYERDPSLFAVFAVGADLTYDIGPDSIWPVLTSSGSDPYDPDPSVFQLITLSRANNGNKDEESFFQVDFDRELDGNFLTSLEFGVKWRDREMTFTKAVDGSTGAERNGYTLSDFTLGQLPVDDFASDLQGSPLPLNWPFPDMAALTDVFSFDGILGDPIIRPQDLTSNFDVSEETLAGYVKANFERDRLRGNFGVRVIETRQENNGFAVEGGVGTPIQDSRTYTDVLPSLNVVFAIQDDLLLRFGAARVMARPTFKELSNAGTINAGAMTANFGNPYLDPYEADTYDFALEWYFQEGALLSAGIFYKDVTSFVTKEQVVETIPGQGDDEFLVNKPVNGSAEVTGYELTYQQNFTGLPAPFNNLGVVTNYTYVDSESTFADPNAEGALLPMPGTSEDTVNLIGFYEGERFSVRLAYNYRSEYILHPLSLGGQNVVRDDYDQLDATVTYNFSDNISLVAEATNLSNSTTYDYAGIDERWVAWRDTGRRVSLNLRANF